MVVKRFINGNPVEKDDLKLYKIKNNNISKILKRGAERGGTDEESGDLYKSID